MSMNHKVHLYYTYNLLLISILCKIIKYRVNFIYCAFHPLKSWQIHCITNSSCWIVASIAIACIYKANRPSYLTVTSSVLFVCLSFEERCVQKFVFQDYFKINQINGSGYCTNFAWEISKISKITSLWRSLNHTADC